MKKIEEIWKELDSSKDIDPRKKIDSIKSLNCYLSLLRSSNTRCFELSLGSCAIRTFEKKFHGVEVYLVELENGNKSICIYLIDSDIKDVFTLFIEDILKNLQDVEDGEKAFVTMQGQFDKWGKLFARIKGELLSKERQRGLYGELNFLYELLNRSFDPVKTVLAWTGPEGSNQDFSNNLTAVEVKTSKATKPSVNIASELQLDWTKLDSLYLLVVHIDEISNGADTLLMLITDIKGKINGNQNLLKLFEDKLDRVGISIGEEKHYDDFGFIIRSKRAYQVQDGFPALTNNIIDNDAIHNVKYQIDLTACAPFELDLEKVIKLMI